MITLFVGIPEDDQRVTVPADWTVAQLLSEYDVSTAGMVQHNGRTLQSAEYNKTLSELGAVNSDTIYVVRKLDSAI
jgi:sulfur carrier protein ThiS